MGYKWDFSGVYSYFNLWMRGLGVTLGYSLGTVLGGLIIGVICGMLLLYRRKWVTLPIHYYVEIFRCTPLLVQIVWFYYALPIVLDVELPAWLGVDGISMWFVPLTAFMTVMVVLAGWEVITQRVALYMGAFSTEIFRGGIISIDKGQWQAARALGMTNGELMRHIILPQAIKRMVPPFVNQSIIQLKNTSLLYVVAIPDLMYTGSIVVSDTFRPLEVYTSVALAYFAILYPLTLWAARLEARVDQ